MKPSEGFKYAADDTDTITIIPLAYLHPYRQPCRVTHRLSCEPGGSIALVHGQTFHVIVLVGRGEAKTHKGAKRTFFPAETVAVWPIKTIGAQVSAYTTHLVSTHHRMTSLFLLI